MRAAAWLGVLALAPALTMGACQLIAPFDKPIVSTDGGMPPPGPEVCDDGADNDGNTLVDCADPACQAEFQCVPAPATGFSLVYHGAGTALACPTGAPPQKLYDPGMPSCDVSGCSCGTSGGMCKVDTKLIGTACMGGPSQKLALAADSCTSTTGTPLGGTFTPNTGTAMCTASGTAQTTAPATATALSTCALPVTGKGCPSGQVCARRPAAGFDAICAAASGQQTCQAELQQRQVVGTALNDQRSCTCGCSGAASCASSLVNLYDAPGCTGTSQTVAADGQCKVFSLAPKSMVLTVNGSTVCAPTAAYTGTVLAVGETTICCP